MDATNECLWCGYDMGNLLYEMVGDDEVHEVNYCSGCGRSVKQALSTHVPS